MAQNKNPIIPLCEMYPGTRMLNGCAMDAASYERHTQRQPTESPPAPVLQPTAPDSYDPFAQEQDFRAIAARAFDEHRASVQPQHTDTPAVEYRPVQGQYLTQEHPQTVHQALISRGSGSYFTSSGSYGSYALSSGSYLASSGSFVPESDVNTASPHEISRTESKPLGVGSDMRLLGGYGLDLLE